ncbi:enoyl-CoA hydratase/isomerase family protein, partial [Rhodococcus sp. NPDC056960]
DRNPQWSPPSIDDVHDDDVARFFTPLGDLELGLQHPTTTTGAHQ